MCPKIRCDEESEKFYKIFWKLNRTSDRMDSLVSPVAVAIPFNFPVLAVNECL
jgi:hypothetical protein